jgi:hypothetical protein
VSYPDTEGLELAGLEEAAKLLGMDVETVATLPKSETLARQRTPFPAPLAELDQGPVWDRAEIEEWQRARAEAWRQTRSGPLPSRGRV